MSLHWGGFANSPLAWPAPMGYMPSPTASTWGAPSYVLHTPLPSKPPASPVTASSTTSPGYSPASSTGVSPRIDVQPFINSPYLPPFPPPQRNTELYQNLMLFPTASINEVERAFKALAMKYHPDRKPVDGGAMFRKVSYAKSILLDRELKKQYDRFREEDRAITRRWCEAAASLYGHTVSDWERAVWDFHLPHIRQAFDGPLLPAPGSIMSWPPADVAPMGKSTVTPATESRGLSNLEDIDDTPAPETPTANEADTPSMKFFAVPTAAKELNDDSKSTVVSDANNVTDTATTSAWPIPTAASVSITAALPTVSTAPTAVSSESTVTNRPQMTSPSLRGWHSDTSQEVKELATCSASEQTPDAAKESPNRRISHDGASAATRQTGKDEPVPVTRVASKVFKGSGSGPRSRSAHPPAYSTGTRSGRSSSATPSNVAPPVTPVSSGAAYPVTSSSLHVPSPGGQPYHFPSPPRATATASQAPTVAIPNQPMYFSSAAVPQPFVPSLYTPAGYTISNGSFGAMPQQAMQPLNYMHPTYQFPPSIPQAFTYS